MSSNFNSRNLLFGLGAGLVTTPIQLLLAYVAGVCATAVQTKELFATILAAATVLPLMLLLVLLLPTLLIAVLTGLTLAFLSSPIHAWFKAIGSVVGLVLGEIVLSALLPMIIVPQQGDFMRIVSNTSVSGSYGAITGFIVGWQLAIMTRGRNP